jgi:hypothetical protein
LLLVDFNLTTLSLCNNVLYAFSGWSFIWINKRAYNRFGWNIWGWGIPDIIIVFDLLLVRYNYYM